MLSHCWWWVFQFYTKLRRSTYCVTWKINWNFDCDTNATCTRPEQLVWIFNVPLFLTLDATSNIRYFRDLSRYTWLLANARTCNVDWSMLIQEKGLLLQHHRTIESMFFSRYLPNRFYPRSRVKATLNASLLVYWVKNIITKMWWWKCSEMFHEIFTLRAQAKLSLAHYYSYLFNLRECIKIMFDWPKMNGKWRISCLLRHWKRHQARFLSPWHLATLVYSKF